MKHLLTLILLLFVTTANAQKFQVGEPIDKVIDKLNSDSTLTSVEFEEGERFWIRAYYYSDNECDPAYEFIKFDKKIEFIEEVQYNYYTGRCEWNAEIQMTGLNEADSTLNVTAVIDTVCTQSTFFYTVKREINGQKAVHILSDAK